MMLRVILSALAFYASSCGGLEFVSFEETSVWNKGDFAQSGEMQWTPEDGLTGDVQMHGDLDIGVSGDICLKSGSTVICFPVTMANIIEGSRINFCYDIAGYQDCRTITLAEPSDEQANETPRDHNESDDGGPGSEGSGDAPGVEPPSL